MIYFINGRPVERRREWVRKEGASCLRNKAKHCCIITYITTAFIYYLYVDTCYYLRAFCSLDWSFLLFLSRCKAFKIIVCDLTAAISSPFSSSYFWIEAAFAAAAKYVARVCLARLNSDFEFRTSEEWTSLNIGHLFGVVLPQWTVS